MPRVGASHRDLYTKEEREEQARKCMELRREGASLQLISDTLGISVGTVSNRLKQFFIDNPAPDITEWRALQNEDLEKLRSKLWEGIDASDGNPDRMARLADRLLKLQERQARLMGLDLPVLAEVTVTHQTGQEAELEALFAEIDAKNAEVLTAIEHGEKPTW